MSGGIHGSGAEQIGKIADRVESAAQKQAQAMQSSLAALKSGYAELAGGIQDVAKAASALGILSEKTADKFLKSVSAVTDIRNGFRGIEEILTSVMRVTSAWQQAIHGTKLDQQAIAALNKAQAAGGGILANGGKAALASGATGDAEGESIQAGGFVANLVARLSPLTIVIGAIGTAATAFIGALTYMQHQMDKNNEQLERIDSLMPRAASVPTNFADTQEAQERRLHDDEELLKLSKEREGVLRSETDQLIKQREAASEQLAVAKETLKTEEARALSAKARLFSTHTKYELSTTAGLLRDFDKTGTVTPQMRSFFKMHSELLPKNSKMNTEFEKSLIASSGISAADEKTLTEKDIGGSAVDVNKKIGLRVDIAKGKIESAESQINDHLDDAQRTHERVTQLSDAVTRDISNVEKTKAQRGDYHDPMDEPEDVQNAGSQVRQASLESTKAVRELTDAVVKSQQQLAADLRRAVQRLGSTA